MKLYYFPGTRAMRVRWMLEELGEPYDLVEVNVALGENRQPDYLAVHPLGSIPALVDEGTSIIESAAIILYLADKFGRLAPAQGTAERGAYYQWVLYAMATLEPPVFTVLQQKVMLPEEKRSEQELARAVRRFGKVAAPIERTLTGRDFLLERGFTAADVVLGGVLFWARDLGLLAEYPALTAYVERLAPRPAAKKAFDAG